MNFWMDYDKWRIECEQWLKQATLMLVDVQQFYVQDCVHVSTESNIKTVIGQLDSFYCITAADMN